MDHPDIITTGNPFANSVFYVNPDIAKLMEQSQNKFDKSSDMAQKIETVKYQPSAVWMDRIDAIKGGAVNGGRLSLDQHMQEAVKQQRAAAKNGVLPPITAVFVVYNLPDRDCAAKASNGTLSSANNGLQIYRTQYIDEIAATFAKYPKVRVVALIEPDSFPNLLTNLSVQKCAQVNQGRVYQQGIQYAIAKFASMKNVYSYVDIGHSGWLGWDDNRQKTVQGFTELVRGATPGGSLDVIKGFASNTANYTPIKEPFLDGASSRADKFYEYNSMIDEQSFVDALRREFTSAGFPNVRFIIDTARNGWGSNKRPTGATGSVATSKIDLRAHRGNWCNVKDAGIGVLPRPTPDPARPYIDAYYWMKPPGESDGTSNPGDSTANEEGKSFDPMCGSSNVDAMSGAPHAGWWFHDQFVMLINNALPAIPKTPVGTGGIGGSSSGSTSGSTTSSSGATSTSSSSSSSSSNSSSSSSSGTPQSCGIAQGTYYYCASDATDAVNGVTDGWGWENGASCIVPNGAADPRPGTCNPGSGSTTSSSGSTSSSTSSSSTSGGNGGTYVTKTEIFFKGKKVLSGGFNIAWFNFAGDFGNGIDQTKLRQVIKDLKDSGGNTLRWWVHTDGSLTPKWSNGMVSGPGNLITDMKTALDIAAAEGVYIVPSLWSFDMLAKNDFRKPPNQNNYNLLNDDRVLDSYNNNVLIPMVKQLINHPGLLAWELFNEPENMTESWFTGRSDWYGGSVPSKYRIQRTHARMAAAIHKAAREAGGVALVTTGSKSMGKYNSNARGGSNWWSDSEMRNTSGGDQDAFLDFYQPHFYNNEGQGERWSPFHNDISWWQVDKPIVIGEFYAKYNDNNVFNISPRELCKRLKDRGYAGWWTWQWNENPNESKECVNGAR